MKPVLTKHNQHLFNVGEASLEEMPSIPLGERAPNFNLGKLSNEASPWYETDEEIAKGLARSEQKKRQLRRVRSMMILTLTVEERILLELRFMYGLTYRQIGEMQDRHASTICRRVKRSIRKLQTSLGVND